MSQKPLNPTAAPSGLPKSQNVANSNMIPMLSKSPKKTAPTPTLLRLLATNPTLSKNSMANSLPTKKANP